ncbi:CRE-NHR-70 protein [Caenorhabditis remanei]|uniref:CRE-NHR-70 protein n=1 Tax=Caenorhabditis remanei TaxID=31234 RepID=E3NB73_CAERE|nr:CRE-NHR-70 protein [Caenorhabditis remanei]
MNFQLNNADIGNGMPLRDGYTGSDASSPNLLSSNKPMNSKGDKPPCSICGEVGNGIHFGAEACRACAAFFRRSVALNKLYRCRGNGHCDILSTIRCMCRACRFTKCIQVGMKREAVQKYRDAYGKRGSDVESPSTSVPIGMGFSSSQNTTLESVEEGGMPILSTLSANYAKLESVRRVVHQESGTSVFQKRTPKAVTYKEANEVSSKECDLVADWILNSYPGFSDLPKEQKKILFRNFFLPFVILQGGHFACTHNRNDVIILASGDFIDCSHPETFYYDPDGRQLMSSEDAVRMFASSFSNYRRNVTDPMLRDNVDSYEFFALCSLVLFDTGLEGQSEECIIVARRIREAIQREILYYYRNVRHIEDPSMRLANLLSLLPALQRATRRFQEDVEISHVFNVYSVDEKFYEMCNGRF